MSIPRIGSYVTHAKLPDLGSGEIITTDGERVVIRFATGEKNFVYALVAKHLVVTSEAPLPRPSKAPRAPRAPRATPRAPRASKKAAASAPAVKG